MYEMNYFLFLSFLYLKIFLRVSFILNSKPTMSSSASSLLDPLFFSSFPQYIGKKKKQSRKYIFQQERASCDVWLQKDWNKNKECVVWAPFGYMLSLARRREEDEFN
jgi:hypothetical protein